MSETAAISGLAIGDIEGLALAIAGCPPGGRQRFLRARLKAAFLRRGAETVRLTRLAAGAPTAINVLSVWVMTRSEELVGEVRQSDQTVLVEASSFDGAGWPLPIRKGDRLTRWPFEDHRQAAHTVIETPAVYTMGEVDLLYRLIVRG